MPEKIGDQGLPTPLPAQPDLPVLDLEKIEELSGELLDKPFAKTPDGQPVTFKTFREGYMKDRDYRRKTEALAQERKKYEGHDETINALRTELDDIKGRLAKGEITPRQAKEEAEAIELTGLPAIDQKVTAFIRSEVGKVKADYEKRLEDLTATTTEKEEKAKQKEKSGMIHSQVQDFLKSNAEKYPDVVEDDVLFYLAFKTDTDGRPFDVEDIPHIVKLNQQRFEASVDRRKKVDADAKNKLPENPKETPPPAKPPVEGDEEEVNKKKFAGMIDAARAKARGIVV